MSLPVPNLDDRSWKQIVDEAVRLIPRYCPEWTNHNASDPGVTLLELYAWMTEMVIYRLNKVPEKNFLTFLDLIGVRLKPPEPARVVLELTPSEGADGELIVRKGTQVATLQAGGGDPVTFETLRDLTLLPVHVVRAASSHRATVADHTEALASGDAREALFAGVQEVERFLYLGDDRFNAFNEEAAVDLFFEAMPGSAGPRVPTITEWQYFDGKRWRDMTVNRAESDSRRLAFAGHPGIEKQIVNGVETYWVRGKLAEPLKDPGQVQLDSVSLRVEILGEGMAPENAFVNIGNYIFLPVDQGKSFHPFGEEPKFDCALYLGHKELFSAPEARIRIEAGLVEPSVVPRPKAARTWSSPGSTGTAASGPSWARPHRWASRACRASSTFSTRPAPLPATGRSASTAPPTWRRPRSAARRPSGSAPASTPATTARPAATSWWGRTGCSRRTGRCGRPASSRWSSSTCASPGRSRTA